MVWPERVVDELEAVEVEVEDGEHPALVALRARDGELEVIHEERAVRQPGERVVEGVVVELLLGDAAVGDVLNLEDEVDALAVRVARERDAPVHPDLVPVLVDVALLHLRGGGAALEQLADVGERGAQIVRVRDGQEVGRQQLRLRVAENLAQAAVDLKPAPLGRDERHADGRVVEGAAEALRRVARVAPARVLRLRGEFHVLREEADRDEEDERRDGGDRDGGVDADVEDEGRGEAPRRRPRRGCRGTSRKSSWRAFARSAGRCGTSRPTRSTAAWRSERTKTATQKALRAPSVKVCGGEVWDGAGGEAQRPDEGEGGERDERCLEEDGEGVLAGAEREAERGGGGEHDRGLAVEEEHGEQCEGVGEGEAPAVLPVRLVEAGGGVCGEQHEQEQREADLGEG